MRREHVIALAVIVAGLSGCLSAPLDAAPGDDDGAASGPGAFTARTLYLSADERLVENVPAAGGIPAGDFILKWATRSGMHPSLAAESGGLLIAPDDVEVTFWVQAELPVLPARLVLPDIAAWFGADGHTPLVAGAELGPLLPGVPIEVTFQLAKPELQPDLEARGSLDLLVSVTMTQLEAHGVWILTGPDHPSRITFHAAHAPGLQAITGDLISGVMVSGMVPLPDRVIGPLGPDLNYVDIPIEVDTSATHLRAHISATGGVHTVDMDMVLLDPAGETITWGVTPYAEETLLLQGAGLTPYQGGTLTLRVANHLGLPMAFEGSIQQA